MRRGGESKEIMEENQAQWNMMEVKIKGKWVKDRNRFEKDSRQKTKMKIRNEIE
jgi:hypothetical protein